MNNLEFVHNALYGEALNIAKNFVPKSDTRPILNFALHTADGDLWATDSTKLIHVKNIHGYKEETLVHPKSGTVARGGNYPDVSRIINDVQFEPLIHLNAEQLKIWMNLFKAISQTMKGLRETFNYVTTMIFGEDCIEVEFLKEKIKMNLPCTVIARKEGLERITFSAEFMKQSLEAHYKLKSPEVQLLFSGQMKPFVIDDNERVRTMILPVRTI